MYQCLRARINSLILVMFDILFPIQDMFKYIYVHMCVCVYLAFVIVFSPSSLALLSEWESDAFCLDRYDIMCECVRGHYHPTIHRRI